MAFKAVQLGADDAANRWVLGHLLAHEGRWAEAEAEFSAAFAIDPNHADALVLYSETVTFDGRPLEAIELLKRALRVNPQPAAWYYWEFGLAYYAARQYELACEMLTVPSTYGTASRRILAATLAQMGKMEEARREGSQFMADNPKFTITQWAASQPARSETVVQHFVEGFRIAGLTE